MRNRPLATFAGRCSQCPLPETRRPGHPRPGERAGIHHLCLCSRKSALFAWRKYVCKTNCVASVVLRGKQLLSTRISFARIFVASNSPSGACMKRSKVPAQSRDPAYLCTTCHPERSCRSFELPDRTFVAATGSWWPPAARAGSSDSTPRSDLFPESYCSGPPAAPAQTTDTNSANRAAHNGPSRTWFQKRSAP